MSTQSLRSAVEDGSVVLHPYPRQIESTPLKAERFVMGDTKKGLLLEVFRVIDGSAQEFQTFGDVPINHRDVKYAITELEKIEGCKVYDVHHHEGEVDLHPICRATLREGRDQISAIWSWANKWANEK